jgi:hypothetical protein
VVTVEPSFIDLLDMVGDEIQVDIAISNHGLIAAQEMDITFDACDLERAAGNDTLLL